MSRVLVVAGGPYQLDLIRAARREGHAVVVVDGNGAAPGLALADVPVVTDIVDGPAVVEVARRERVDAVVSGASDAALIGLSAVVDALGLPGPSSEVVARCHDKLVTARAVRAAGLACPETEPWPAGSDADRAAAIAAVGGFPLVVKPATAAGGRGVSLLTEAAGLDAAVEKARRYGPHVLLQRWVRGRSLGVEAFVWGGRVVAVFPIEDHYARPFVSPVGHGVPAEVDPALAAKVDASVSAWVDALRLADGAANFDLRIEGGRPTLIEVNPRLGGSSITRLLELGLGIDPSAAALACALGRSPLPHLAPGAGRPVASRLFVARGHGPWAAPDAAVARWRDRALELTVDDGALTVDDFTLLGRCLVEGPTVAEAAALAGAIAADIEASARPAPQEGT